MSLFALVVDRESITEGLILAVRAYYEDHTDATDVDPEFHEALERLAPYAEMDVHDLIVAGEMLVRKTNPRRKFDRSDYDDEPTAWCDECMTIHEAPPCNPFGSYTDTGPDYEGEKYSGYPVRD